MKVVQFTIPVAGEHSVIVQEDTLPHFYDHLHRHNETQITWIMQGEGTLLAGDYMQRFKAGDIYIIGANQPHLFKSDPVYFDKRNKKKVHSLTLFFDAQSLFGSVLNLPEMKSVLKFVQTTFRGMQVPESSCQQVSRMILQVKEQKNAYRLASFLQLLQLLAGIKKWKVLSTVTAPYSITESEGLRMNDIYQYTMEHYTENIALSSIASVAHLTPQAFCRYFKKHTRKTYISFLNEIRITEACKKMVRGDFESFASIAYHAGFNNVVTFNRVFKKMTGRSPSEYLKEWLGKAEA
jgi:AraC-like DNA-binding protein